MTESTLVQDFLKAAEQGQLAILKNCLEKVLILIAPIAKVELLL